MSNAAVFVQTSVYEGSPNTLIQAMGCGTPVVSTDCPSGPREILEDGTWGTLTPVGDHVALATAISDAIDEPLPSSRLVARASQYSADSSINQYADLIATVLQAKRQTGADTRWPAGRTSDR